MLGTLEEEQKKFGKFYLSPLIHAYNATKNDSTGFSTHFLMFGWQPRLSVDAYLGTTSDSGEAATEPHMYAEKLKDRLQFAYTAAERESSKSHAKNNAESKPEVGDRVLVRNVGLEGKQKLADKWSKDVYQVTSIQNLDILVYKVKRVEGSKSTCTLHRNMLLPFDYLPCDPVRTKQVQKKPDVPKATLLELSSESWSSDSDSDRYVIPQRRPGWAREDNVHFHEHSKRTASDSRSPSIIDPDINPPLKSVNFQTSRSRQYGSSLSEPTSHCSTPSHVSHESTQFGSPEKSAERSFRSPTILQGDSDRRSVRLILSPPAPQVSQQKDSVQQPLRRSTRDRKPPNRLGQWVYSQTVYYV